MIDLIKEIKDFEISLSRHFVGREEEARVVTLALASKQHACFIGPPGIAKSAVVLQASKMLNAPFYYILITKFTTVDELVGYVDPVKFKQGIFKRNTTNKITEAKIAFIDEIFKGSSELLNCLLNIMNERVFTDIDGTVHKIPLHSLFSASNETPGEELSALYDRFLKHFPKPLETSKIQEAIEYIISNSISNSNAQRTFDIAIFESFSKILENYLVENKKAIAKAIAHITIAFRQEGLQITDRTAITYLPRLTAAYCLLYNKEPKKASIALSKYLLWYPEDIERYKRVLDTIIPTEIREAESRIEKAQELAAEGDLKSAKRAAAEALQSIQGIYSNPEKLEMYREEVAELLKKAEELQKKIESIERALAELKVRK
ncbi:MAG: AAA family ATPase [Archaeoglobaceae archaeon]|nr:AAA family ATPase [Archaeoglobaceae archaeon]